MSEKSEYESESDVEPEVSLVDQEINEIDEAKIASEFYQKICKSHIFEGFIPKDKYFDFTDKDLIKTMHSKKVHKK